MLRRPVIRDDVGDSECEGEQEGHRRNDVAVDGDRLARGRVGNESTSRTERDAKGRSSVGSLTHFLHPFKARRGPHLGESRTRLSNSPRNQTLTSEKNVVKEKKIKRLGILELNTYDLYDI